MLDEELPLLRVDQDDHVHFIELQIAAAGVAERAHHLSIGLARDRHRTPRTSRRRCRRGWSCRDAPEMRSVPGSSSLGTEFGPATDLRKRKWSSIGCPENFPSLATGRCASVLGWWPAKRLTPGVEKVSTLSRCRKKSRLQKLRRYSPSVTERSPSASCLATARRIADVLDRLEVGGGDFLALELGAGFLDFLRAQQAADMLGAKRRLRFHGVTSISVATLRRGTLDEQRKRPRPDRC